MIDLVNVESIGKVPEGFTVTAEEVFGGRGKLIYNIYLDSLGPVTSDACPMFASLTHAEASMILDFVELIKSLRTRLGEAVEIIEVWHGGEAWETYKNNSPEMQRLFSDPSLRFFPNTKDDVIGSIKPNRG